MCIRNQERLLTPLSEPRAETKFSELIGHVNQGFGEIRGEIRSTNARLDYIERSVAGIKVLVVAAGVVGVAAIVIATVALGHGI